MMAEIPESIGKYRVLDLLGRGGMGAVYKAEDLAIGRLVAIKVLLTSFDNREMLQRFFSEARANGKLQHPNIVTLYDLGDMDGSPYLVMEFLQGTSLDKIISSGQPIAILDAVKMVRQVCSALHFAHENEIIHRDVKPGNVVLMPSGLVKLVDFGIAKYGNERLTRTGMAVGSANYMSPEQITGGSVDRRTDVYSTGILLYELLTRQLPFAGTDIVSTIHRVLNAPIPDLAEGLPDAPQKLREIICRVLAKDAALRYQSAEELSEDLLLVEEQLQHTAVHHHIQSIKEAILARDWTLATERVSQARRVDAQDREVRNLSREIRLYSEPLPRDEKLAHLVELAVQAGAQGRDDDLLRLCSFGLEIEPENHTLLQLREGAVPAGQAPAERGVSVATFRATSRPGKTEAVLRSSAKSEAAGADLATTRAGQQPISRDRSSRKFRMYLIAACCLLGVIALAGWIQWKHQSNNQPVRLPQQTQPSAQTASTTSSDTARTPTSSPDQPQPSTNSSISPAETEKPFVAPQSAANASSEEAEWRKLQRSPSLAALDQFLIEHPNSPLRAQAEFQREDLAWNKTQQQNSESAFSDYLGRYPSGRYADRAREALLRLDQRTIDSATDSAQLDPLLSKYPAGDMHVRILSRMDDLTWAQAVNNRARIYDYLRSFPNGKHVADARIQSRDLSTATASVPTHVPATTGATVDTVPDRAGADDQSSIQRTLAAYEDAYDRQDVGAIAQVWPTIPSGTRKSIEESFKKMKSTHLTNQVLSETISGSSATLRVSQTIAFSTGGALQSKSDKVTMEMQKGDNSAWLIKAIH